MKRASHFFDQLETLNVKDADTGLPLLPGKAESELPLPIELSQDDLKTFEVTVQGHTFYDFGYAVCPKCGKGLKIQRIILPDDEVKWYLIFACKDFDAPTVSEPTNTVTATATDAPGGGPGSTTEPQQ